MYQYILPTTLKIICIALLWMQTIQTGKTQQHTAITVDNPVMTTPQDYATQVTTSVTFRWQSVHNATRYGIFVVDTRYPNTPLLNDHNMGNTTSFTVNNLQPNTSYKWRIIAYHHHIRSDSQNPAFRFTTGSNTAQQLRVWGQPSAPATGITNKTQFVFEARVSTGNGNPVQVYLEFLDYGGVRISMPAPNAQGITRLHKTLSGPGQNRPFRYKAVQRGQATQHTPTFYMNVYRGDNYIPTVYSLEEWLPAGKAKDSYYGTWYDKDIDDVTMTNLIVHHTGDHLYEEFQKYSDPRQFMQDKVVSLTSTDDGIALLKYNYFITPDGTIFEGTRGLAWHALSFNQHAQGVCLVGDYSNHRPSEKVLNSLRWILTRLSEEFGINPQGKTVFPENIKGYCFDYDREKGCTRKFSTIWGNNSGYLTFDTQNNFVLPNICGHRNCRATQCPGNHVYAKLPEIREAVIQSIHLEAGQKHLTKNTKEAIEESLQIPVQLYPNPAENLLNIRLSQAQHPGSLLTLKDTRGKVWITQILDNPLTSIPVTHLPPGMYIAYTTGKEAQTPLRIWIK